MICSSMRLPNTFATATTARSSHGARPRRMPRAPTSAPSRRSCVPEMESFRSFTRTTFMPCVSTIWRFRRSRASRISSGCR